MHLNTTPIVLHDKKEKRDTWLQITSRLIIKTKTFL